MDSGTLPCFTPDVPVATPSGERPIGELSAGDRVWSFTPGGVARAVRITRVHRGLSGALVDIRTATVTLRGATPAHPIHAASRGRYVLSLIHI